MSDHRDARLGAALDDPASERAVVERTERNLDGSDRRQLERLVQLRPVDVREPHVPHEAFLCEPRQRPHGGPPRRPRVGRVNEVEIDREPVESVKARLAVGVNRLRPSVRDPPAAGPRHASLRHDPGSRVRFRAAKAVC